MKSVASCLCDLMLFQIITLRLLMLEMKGSDRCCFVSADFGSNVKVSDFKPSLTRGIIRDSQNEADLDLTLHVSSSLNEVSTLSDLMVVD